MVAEVIKSDANMLYSLPLHPAIHDVSHENQARGSKGISPESPRIQSPFLPCLVLLLDFNKTLSLSQFRTYARKFDASELSTPHRINETQTLEAPLQARACVIESDYDDNKPSGEAHCLSGWLISRVRFSPNISYVGYLCIFFTIIL